MDYFHQQDLARKYSGWMIFLFIVAVICVVGAITGIAFALMAQQITSPKTPEEFNQAVEFVTGTGIVTLLVILLGSCFRCMALRSGGGKAVAECLGGRLVEAGAERNLKERQFLNIVEEMALASGLPIPAAYVLDEEPSINAFAAGNTPEDAVVAVTRGTLETLDRDELQGVIGHEFSHILNGDMNLNIRIMGVVYGITLIYLIGLFILRSMAFSSGGDDKKEGGARLVIALLSLAVMIIGLIGLFFGNVIKAALSRQREYLADASAVQFTRNPQGIASALKKIGGFKAGDQKMQSPQAAEASHLFFSEFSSSFFSLLFATHPPLEKRIARLDPRFNLELAAQMKELEEQNRQRQSAQAQPVQVAGFASTSGFSQSVVREYKSAEGTLGQSLNAKQANRGPRAVKKETEQLPPQLTVSQTLTNSLSACAFVFAVLTDRENEEIVAIQEKIVGNVFGGYLLKDWNWLKAEVKKMAPSQQLMHLKMAVSALRQLSPNQYIAFREAAWQMIEADHVVDLNEFIIFSLVFRQLDLVFAISRPSNCTGKMTVQVFRAAVLVLSRVAYAGSDEPEAQKYAFRIGLQTLQVADADLLPQEACANQAFQVALQELDQLEISWKRKFLNACSVTINADGVLTEEEAFLNYGIAAALGIYA